MPIYGYRCRSCGHEVEILQKMSDAPPKACAVCGGELTKMVYAAGIVYKGSGYYSTDYKSASSRGSETTSSNGESKESKTGSEGAGEGKPAKEASESKPASKSESKPAESSSSE
jgi:putative FmdB family regulatory protein